MLWEQCLHRNFSIFHRFVIGFSLDCVMQISLSLYLMFSLSWMSKELSFKIFFWSYIISISEASEIPNSQHYLIINFLDCYLCNSIWFRISRKFFKSFLWLEHLPNHKSHKIHQYEMNYSHFMLYPNSI